MEGGKLSKGPKVMATTCLICNKKYKNRFSLKRHIISVHKQVPDNTFRKSRLICPFKECKAMFTRNNFLREHLETMHNIVIEFEELQFSTKGDFEDWLINMQNATKSQYIKENVRVHGNTKEMDLTCHRSFKYNSGVKARLRALQLKGSKKTGVACSSRVHVIFKIDNDQVSKVTALFWKTHCGHDANPAHLEIDKHSRRALAEKLLGGVPIQKVLDDVRNKPHDYPERMLSLKRQDVYNTIRDYKIDFSSLKQKQVKPHSPNQVFECKYCKKDFYSKWSFKIHMKNCQEIQPCMVESLALLAAEYTCVFCTASFVDVISLESHIEAKHQFDETHQFTEANTVHGCVQCDRLDDQRDDHEAHQTTHNSEDRNTYPCRFCSKTFTIMSSLTKHFIQVHSTKKVCPLCSFTSASFHIKLMYQHFNTEHKIPLAWEKHKFKCLEEFNAWKSSIETNSFSSYSKQCFNSNRFIFYLCHRNGSFNSAGGNVSLPNGSGKTNAFCPSEMKVYIKKSGVDVCFLPVHIGHSTEEEESQMIEGNDKIIKHESEPVETSGKDILQTACEDLNKITINREDQVNYINPHCEEDLGKHQVPVYNQSFIMEVANSEKTHLLVCKALNVYSDQYPYLKENDFLLIYMSKVHKTLLMKHCKNVVCVDYTVCTKFHLFTLSILNDREEGIPVAFMFTNSVEGTTLTTFFDEIKKSSGTISCNLFMSDIGEMIYSAWRRSMGVANQRVFSSWHVLNSWRQNLNTKVESKEKRELVFNTLQSLIRLEDEDKFLRELNTFFLKEEECKPFLEYFIREFLVVRPFKTWAHSFGNNATLNNSLSLEEFNRIIKYIYLKGNKHQNVEDTVNIALNAIKEKEFHINLDTKLGKLRQKWIQVRRKHKKSLTMDIAQVQEFGDMWKVYFAKGENFYIIKRKGTCNNCQLECTHCKTCYHEYMCSCAVYAVENNMCEHIHLMMQSLSASRGLVVVDTVEINDTNIIYDDSLIMCVDECDPNTNNESVVIFSEENLNSNVIVENEDHNYDQRVSFNIAEECVLVEKADLSGFIADQDDKVNEVNNILIVEEDIQTLKYEDCAQRDLGPHLESDYKLQQKKSELVNKFQQFLNQKIATHDQIKVVENEMKKLITKSLAEHNNTSFKAKKAVKRRNNRLVPSNNPLRYHNINIL